MGELVSWSESDGWIDLTMQWPFGGRSPGAIGERLRWCEENLTGRFACLVWDQMRFESADDAIMFKMKFGEVKNG